MKAKDYTKRRQEAGGSTKARLELLERKNWHLTQLLGAILFASEDPETGFTFMEYDATSVDPKDVEFIREKGENGKAKLTIRIKKGEESADAAAAS